MMENLNLAKEIHYGIFGLAFCLLIVRCLYLLIHARNSLSINKSRLCYAINGALVVFNSNQALMLLLHRYLSDELSASHLAFEKFLFKLGFPCLVAAYLPISYPCLDYLNDRTRFVFDLLLLQCCLFIISDIVGAKLSYLEPFERLVLYMNIIISVVSLIYAISFSMRYKDCFGSTKQMDNLNLRGIDIKENGNQEQSNVLATMSATTRPPVVVLGISCISIACVVIRSCIFFGGNLKSWDNDMESWYSWMYASVFRGVELGNVAIMSHLIHRISLRQCFMVEKRLSTKTAMVNA